MEESVQSEVLRHLFACAACREEAEGLRELWNQGRSIPAESPNSKAMRARFSAMLKAQNETPQPAIRYVRAVSAWIWPRRPAFQVLLAMFMLAVCVFAAQKTGVLVTLRLLPETKPESPVVAARPELVPEPEPQVATATGMGSIEGLVSRLGTSEPIADVSIVLTSLDQQSLQANFDSIETSFGAAAASSFLKGYMSGLSTKKGPDNSSVSRNTSSDSTGHFVLKDIPAGRYVLVAYGEGYFGTGTTLPAIASRVTWNVTVTAQQPTAIIVRMVKGIVISGRILDSSRQPAPNTSVQVLRASILNGKPTLALSSSGTTDDRGEYRIYGLPPGDYYLAANPKVTNTVRGAGSSEVQLRTFYPNVTNAAMAVPVVFKDGDEISGMDITLLANVLVKVSGRVIGSIPNGPPRNANVTLTLVSQDSSAPPNTNLAASVAVALASPNGAPFEIPNVPPGSYYLLASTVNAGLRAPVPPISTSQLPQFGRTAVNVGTANVDGITIGIHEGVELKGRVTLDGNPAPNPLRISLEPPDAFSSFAIYRQVARSEPTIQPNGEFTIPAVPEGRYRFNVRAGATPVISVPMGSTAAGAGALIGQALKAAAVLPEGSLLADFYVEDVRADGMSVYDNGLDIGIQPPVTVELILKSKSGGVEGIVYSLDQKPAAGATVVLIPPQGRRQNVGLYKSVSSDADGHFTMRGIAPGDYKLFAWAAVQPGAFQNAEFLAQYEDRGRTIHVMAGTRSTELLNLITDSGK